MLTYLILTSRALLVSTVILGLINAYVRYDLDSVYHKRIILILQLAGVIMAIATAYLRNATSKVDSAILNGWIYSITLASFLIWLISVIPAVKRIAKPAGVTCLGIQAAMVTAYSWPEVLGYPYHVYLSERTVISTDFLMSMIGMIFGLILMVVLFFAVSKSAARLNPNGRLILIGAELMINALLRVSGLYSVLFQKKLIKSNHTMFTYTVFVKNHSDYFIFLALAAVCASAVMLWVRSFRQNEPYSNPAEHRKIRAKWRNIRRWASAMVMASVLGVCNLTVAEAMNATDVTLSPIEDASAVDDENIYVGFDLVNDGHLHRFAYETADGVQIRFIVIQKSGNSYGVGLDACDVCGETGYYEKDGQVVCNLCDVVMNISTIGFKGGCNPIVIPYEISGGQIRVPISGLLEYEREFK